MRSFYVDDVIIGGNIIVEVWNLKKIIVLVFGEIKFIMYKWNFNEFYLES